MLARKPLPARTFRRHAGAARWRETSAGPEPSDSALSLGVTVTGTAVPERRGDRVATNGVGAQRDRDPEPRAHDTDRHQSGADRRERASTTPARRVPPQRSRDGGQHDAARREHPADRPQDPGGVAVQLVSAAGTRRTSSGAPQTRAGAPVSDTNQRAQLVQPGRADAVDVGELVDAGEPAVGLPPRHDRRGGDRADPGQGVQLLRRSRR